MRNTLNILVFTRNHQVKYENIEFLYHLYCQEKKKEIWLSPVTKAPTSTEKSKKQRDNIKNATKNFDYTTIADRLRTVSSHSTCVVKQVYVRTTYPLTVTAV